MQIPFILYIYWPGYATLSTIGLQQDFDNNRITTSLIATRQCDVSRYCEIQILIEFRVLIKHSFIRVYSSTRNYALLILIQIRVRFQCVLRSYVTVMYE